jgi:DNA repair exonuclease SbcCD ATPase subunit
MKRLVALLICFVLAGCGQEKFDGSNAYRAQDSMYQLARPGDKAATDEFEMDCMIVAIDGKLENFTADGLSGAWERMDKLTGMTAEQIQDRAAEFQKANPKLREQVAAAEAERVKALKARNAKMEELQRIGEEGEEKIRQWEAARKAKEKQPASSPSP